MALVSAIGERAAMQGATGLEPATDTASRFGSELLSDEG